jgi:hypothetical protein
MEKHFTIPRFSEKSDWEIGLFCAGQSKNLKIWDHCTIG